MGDLILALTWGIFELLLVGTGALVIRAVSLGGWKTERLSSNEHGVRAAAGALTFVQDGARVVTTVGQTVVGLAVWLATLCAAVYFWS